MNLRDWVDGLSPRERNLVYGAGALLALALIYLVLLLPFQTSGKRLNARVQQKSSDLAWMQAQAPAAMQAAGAARGAGKGESLVVLVDRTARDAGLGAALRDQSPDGNSGLRVRLEGASFDTLVVWLASLQQQHGVTIDVANIDAAGPGVVNATLGLKQAGATG
jgi:general secretion pathway protein M